jgi:tRNA(fMet)-specific endonuclease VapC
MVLDTNAYSALALAVPSVVELVNDAAAIKLPLPVVAELRYGFAKGDRPQQNEALLQQFLAQPQVTIILPTLQTTAYYAELQLLCRQRGRALSHNDIWIAALTRESDDTLVTYDKDFAVLADVLGGQLTILE